MAWQMVRTMFQIIKSEASIVRTTFAGLCSVLRAGLLVLETRKYVDEEVATEAEIEAYLRILTWFSRRWTTGREYLGRAEEILGSRDGMVRTWRAGQTGTEIVDGITV